MILLSSLLLTPVTAGHTEDNDDDDQSHQHSDDDDEPFKGDVNAEDGKEVVIQRVGAFFR